jgi:translation initiation factor IF-3
VNTAAHRLLDRIAQDLAVDFRLEFPSDRPAEFGKKWRAILQPESCGEQRVVSIMDALQMARDQSLDLVEVAPNSVPPVCKIMDFGKFKFEQEKKLRESKKNQKVVQLKEVRMQPKIEKHDIEFKVKHILEFLGEGDKIKVTIRFRGREMAHQDLGIKVLERIRADMDAETKVEQMPKMENRQMVMVLTPR